MSEASHEFIASPPDNSKAPERRLIDAWIANCCGDEGCMARRLRTAVSVLYGRKTHIEYAEAVDNYFALVERINQLEQMIGEISLILRKDITR